MVYKFSKFKYRYISGSFKLNTNLDLWQKIINYLKEYINKNDLDLWLKETNLISYKNNIIELSIPNKFFKEWIDDNCLSLIQDYFKTQFDANITLKYTVIKNENSNNQDTSKQKNTEQSQQSQTSNILSALANTFKNTNKLFTLIQNIHLTHL